jgi:hypothetical protein
MKHYIHITIFLSYLLLSRNIVFCQEAENKIEYPIVDVTVGIGLLWLVQANMSISPVDHFYIQARISHVPAVAYEFGGVLGYQTRLENHLIIRGGIGYSQGEVIKPFFGKPNHNGERFESLYVRMDLLRQINNYLIFNSNVNISRLSSKPILSFNFTVGYCLFRKSK